MAFDCKNLFPIVDVKLRRNCNHPQKLAYAFEEIQLERNFNMPSLYNINKILKPFLDNTVFMLN